MTREEAINAITQFIENYAYGNDLIGLKMAIETLKEERPHGEWIPSVIGRATKYKMCKECGFEVDKYVSNAYNFCPNCGADMRTQNDRSWDTSERGVSGSVKNSIAQEEGDEK